jgi:TPR repeat protein
MAQSTLGWWYHEGQGVPRDDTEALKWICKAAEQNDAWAQNNLGLMYSEGRGVPRDYAKAVEWYRKASEQNLPLAQMNLGSMYLKGHGVPRDEAQAAAWFQKAASQGNENAKQKLVMLDELRKIRKNRIEFFAVLAGAGVVMASMVAYRVTRKSAPAHESRS